MLQLCSVVDVLDNSGVRKVKVFHVKGNRSFGKVGDIFLGSVLKSHSRSKYKKGDVVRGLFLKTSYRSKFLNNSKSLKFLKNSCILVSSSNEPLGSRISGSFCYTLKKTGFTKVLSLINKTV